MLYLLICSIDKRRLINWLKPRNYKIIKSTISESLYAEVMAQFYGVYNNAITLALIWIKYLFPVYL